MPDLKRINKYRVTDGPYATHDHHGLNGMFRMKINGLECGVICGEGDGWLHVSVSIIGSTTIPSWSMMCQVRDLFFDPEDCVVQYHPKKSEYVNTHPNVLHLWKYLDGEFPRPTMDMV